MVAYNANMKAKTSIIVSFVFGAAIASLPFTLNSGHTVAQGAGPAQSQGGVGGFGGGSAGVGQVGGSGQGFPAQNRQLGSTMVSTSGDVIYKIRMSNMAIEGQIRLPALRGAQGGNQPARANGRASQGGGNIPPII